MKRTLFELLWRINGYTDEPDYIVKEAKTNEDGSYTLTVEPTEKKEDEKK